MKHGIVVNNIAINIAKSKSAMKSNWHKSSTVKIGDVWDGSVFTTPDLTLEHAQAVATERLAARVVDEVGKDFTVGGITTSVMEMKDNKDLLDGDADVTLNLRSGPTLIRAGQQANAKTFIHSRFRDIRNRESVIAELLEAQTTPGGIISTLNAEIESGWPS